MTTDNSYSDLQLRERLVKKFSDLGIDGRIDLLLMFYADNKYKSRITTEQKEVLDFIFSGFYPRMIEDEGQSHIENIEDRRHHNEHDLKRETLDIMEEEKLVTSDTTIGYLEYTPTALGHRINERGGWKKHVEREEANRKLIVSVSESVIKTNYVQWGAAAMTVVIIAFTAFFTWQQKEVSRKALEQVQSERQDKSTQKQLLEQVQKYQYLVDSMNLQLDKLISKKLPTQNEDGK